MRSQITTVLLSVCLALLLSSASRAQDRPKLFSLPDSGSLANLDAEALLEPKMFKNGIIMNLDTQSLLKSDRVARFALDVMSVKGATVTLTSIDSPSAESKAWRGVFDGGEMTLVLRQGAALRGNRIEREPVVAGTIHTTDGSTVQIRHVRGNTVLLRTFDVNKIPRELEPRVPPVKLAPVRVVDPKESDPAAKTGPFVFDVAVFYTAAAKDGAGGTSQVKALIDLAVTEANTAYSESGINAKLRLVYSAETTDDESGSFNGMLTRLQNPTDGHMDEVHQKRDEHGADLVALICEDSSSCGLGYRMQTESAGFDKFAFSVTSRNCATGYYSFAHELGHNMGCCHDAANPCADPLFPYAYGWHFSAGGTEYRTIMAYAPGIRIQRFSNPDVSYLGVQTGKSGEAENARTINNTADTVSAFRQTKRCKEIIGEADALKAEIKLLQEELQTASPGVKPFLIKEIKRLQVEIGQLHQEGAKLGCEVP